jgi:hypothetical protein
MAHRTGSVAVLAAPLVIPQGADWSTSWLWAEGSPAGQPAGWPSQWRARMEVRTARGGTLLARFHTSDVTVAVDGLITLATYNVGTPSTVEGVPNGGTAGQISVALAAAASEAWTWSDGSRAVPFDLEVWNAVTGRGPVRFLEGTVALSGAVTTGV